MLVCGVEHEDEMPELWRMAASAGKRDRIAVYRAVQNTEPCIGAVGVAPVVTPDLTKQLMGLMFGGSDPDDLAEDIQPFSMVIMDHRSTNTPCGRASTRAVSKLRPRHIGRHQHHPGRRKSVEWHCKSECRLRLHLL
jgi:hypothetical protein